MPSFMLPVLDFIVMAAGGALTTFFVATALVLSVYALLELAEDSMGFFKRCSRIVGVVVAVTGLLLPFRGLSFVGTLLCFWWTSILFEVTPHFSVLQVIGNTIISVIFWASNGKNDEFSFFRNVGDWSVCVFLPLAFALVLFSRKSDISISRNNNNLSNMRIPLSQWLNSLYHLVCKFV